MNLLNSDKFAPLHVACSVGNESVASYLLFKKHVDSNVVGDNGWVPLEFACQFGHPHIVSLLLKDKKTNINYSNPIRGSCLHLSAKADHFAICQILLLNNIDLTLKNEVGKLAKDVTNSKKILDRIAWYENNKDLIDNNNKYGGAEVIDEIAEDEELALSS